MAKIYNEDNVEIDDSQVDLDKGYLVDDTLTIHHPEIQEVLEQSHLEVITEYYETDPETGEPILDPETGDKIIKGQDVEKIIDTPYVPGSPAWDETIDISRYKLYTPEELDAREKEQAANAIVNAQVGQRALLDSLVTETVSRAASDEHILGITTFLPEYDSKSSYSNRECVMYNGAPYRALKEVLPGTAPSDSDYWRRIGTPNDKGVYPWVQPTLPEHAYSVGDKVTFAGKTYTSVVNYNVWSPSAYGWSVEDATPSDV